MGIKTNIIISKIGKSEVKGEFVLIRDAPEVKIGLSLVYFWNMESSEAVCVAGENASWTCLGIKKLPGLPCCVNNIINLYWALAYFPMN